MADGRWPMADGRWPIADGRWPMAKASPLPQRDGVQLAASREERVRREVHARVDQCEARLPERLLEWDPVAERAVELADEEEPRLADVAVRVDDGGGHPVFGERAREAHAGTIPRRIVRVDPV